MLGDIEFVIVEVKRWPPFFPGLEMRETDPFPLTLATLAVEIVLQAPPQIHECSFGHILGNLIDPRKLAWLQGIEVLLQGQHAVLLAGVKHLVLFSNIMTQRNLPTS